MLFAIGWSASAPECTVHPFGKLFPAHSHRRNACESSPEMRLVITVNNVVKQFGRFAALRGVTAEFDAGRFHAILGENGAGKTTLLRALAGLAQPTRGKISIFGKSSAGSLPRYWIYGASVAAL